MSNWSQSEQRNYPSYIPDLDSYCIYFLDRQQAIKNSFITAYPRERNIVHEQCELPSISSTTATSIPSKRGPKENPNSGIKGATGEQLKSMAQVEQHLQDLSSKPKKGELIWLYRKPKILYDPHANLHFLYGLAYAKNLREFWWFGETEDPQHRFRILQSNLKKKFKDEVVMVILICEPCSIPFCQELEAVLISYGKNNHKMLGLTDEILNDHGGSFKARNGFLEKICENVHHRLYNKVGIALRLMLDVAEKNGPRIFASEIGTSEIEKKSRKRRRNGLF
jgi:hypothetical protein